jgi:hypothetical protein
MTAGQGGCGFEQIHPPWMPASSGCTGPPVTQLQKLVCDGVESSHGPVLIVVSHDMPSTIGGLHVRVGQFFSGVVRLQALAVHVATVLHVHRAESP